MSGVRRIYVEKKKGFDVEAQGLLADLRRNLRMTGLSGVRVILRYDIEGISDEEYQAARCTIFAEPPVDVVYDESVDLPADARILAVEYLPGQYDQRADSAAQCIQILARRAAPLVRTARLIVLEGRITAEDYRKIKDYCINPLEAREASLKKPLTLTESVVPPPDVEILSGFTAMNDRELRDLKAKLDLAMSDADLAFCRDYFSGAERRDPSLTEIRVLDTYWSDHCRHTTFLTVLDRVDVEQGPGTGPLRKAYGDYLAARRSVYAGDENEKDVCLMDLATIAMKEMKKKGLLDDLEVSGEINAASIVVDVDMGEGKEQWLVMFKNETHNHPTEIEPFGGAATCLGGAIRDPLSGRSYVYQAMRVTGSGDPRAEVEDTLPGKLPQRKITVAAAAGFSSYGNQVGLATGQVAEIYDEGYVAKRMEIGAVIGAAPRAGVRREKPESGDVIILLGGRTGRDGCGGATGSSKAHTEESLTACSAEVQKGNPPTERKIQRLFRNPAVSRMIKRCNDFGAGGVAVAAGELADGLEINLDLLPKKYEGLDGTELAISESQERMAVVVGKDCVDDFRRAAREENLEATPVGTVTAGPRLKMYWRGKTVVDISREFLNTNGVKNHAKVRVASPGRAGGYFAATDIGKADNLEETWLSMLGDLNVCAQKGLVERFDSTIGAGTVLMPFGGKHQLTPAECMAAKIPLLHGETDTGTLMSYGYNPLIAKWSPFHGAVYAIIEAAAKIAAAGGDFRKIRLTLQEYFERLESDPVRWGRPFAALLGAFYAQRELGIPAIGGKDSMSGTFKDMHVPPTLVAFAVAPADMRRVISPEFKQCGSLVALVRAGRDADGLPDFAQLKKNYALLHDLIVSGRISAAQSIRHGGLAAAVSKMCFGNKIGIEFTGKCTHEMLFAPDYGSIVLEIPAEVELDSLPARLPWEIIGRTCGDFTVSVNGARIDLERALEEWMKPLEGVFPTRDGSPAESVRQYGHPGPGTGRVKSGIRTVTPRIFMPVFPGTNCEFDTARAFEKAGGMVDTLVFRNLTPEDIEETVSTMVKRIAGAQIIMLPGGFSAGDEPDGSGKFIATVFHNPRVREAVMKLLKERDGLILGICNGFQALIKLGLVPYGEIREMDADSPTLTFNTIGRHVSCLVRTKAVSGLSPWLAKVAVGDIRTIPVSHGEGRFVAPPGLLEKLGKNGQIATQYVDLDGNPSMDIRFNPNGSMGAVEGITSPDGRVFGKMGHSERAGRDLYKNVPGEKYQPIFEAGVEYFL
ncbi:MAG: phosphoribosylformylglycinamidine synthase [Bacillota bacterium]